MVAVQKKEAFYGINIFFAMDIYKRNIKCYINYSKYTLYI